MDEKIYQVKKGAKRKKCLWHKAFSLPAKQGHFVGLQWDDYFRKMKRRKRILPLS